MRVTSAFGVLVTLLIVSGTTLATPIDLTFQPPGGIKGAIAATNSTWLLLLSENSTELNGHAGFAGSSNQYTRQEEALQTVQVDTFGGYRLPPIASVESPPTTFGAQTAELHGNQFFSLFVVAEEIRFESPESAASLEAIGEAQCLNSIV